MNYLMVEGNPTEPIHVCEARKGYTKMMDTREYSISLHNKLIDVKTLYLKYIAQENGYQVIGEKKINVCAVN
jgi:FdhE protein